MSQPQPPGQQPYPPQSQQPPYGGYAPIQQPPTRKAKKWPWIVGAIVLLIALAGIFGGGGKTPSTTPAAGQATTAPAAPTVAKEPAAPAKRTVVYEVTGAGQAMNITYVTDGKASQEQVGQVKLPWTKQLELPAGEAFQMVSLVAQAGQGTPEIAAKITVDGKVVKEGKSSGQYAVLTINENIGSFK